MDSPSGAMSQLRRDFSFHHQSEPRIANLPGHENTLPSSPPLNGIITSREPEIPVDREGGNGNSSPSKRSPRRNGQSLEISSQIQSPERLKTPEGLPVYMKRMEIACSRGWGQTQYSGRTDNVQLTPTKHQTAEEKAKIDALFRQARYFKVPFADQQAWVQAKLRQHEEELPALQAAAARKRIETKLQTRENGSNQIKPELDTGSATQIKTEMPSTGKPSSTVKTEPTDETNVKKDNTVKESVPSSQRSVEGILASGAIVRNPNQFLSDEQKAVLHQVLNTNSSVFFTGAAGTGKSVLSRCIIDHLRRKYRGPDAVAVTATTGLAAVNIGGITVHSFAGIGLGNGDMDALIRKVQDKRQAVLRWKRCQALVIDEVSMLRADLLDRLEVIARVVREDPRPFGGIQVVMSGDMFQLPPIVAPNEVAQARDHEDPDSVYANRIFCFDALCWPSVVQRTFNLTQVFRQADPEFVRVLNELREGRCDTPIEQLFRSLNRPVRIPKGLQPTRLFPLRREADNANRTNLERKSGTKYVYKAADWIDDRHRDIVSEKTLNSGLAAESVELKTGAQVMLIKNVNAKLVNGTIGRVIGFMTNSAYGTAMAGDSEGPTEATIAQLDADAEANASRPANWSTELIGAKPGANPTKDRIMAQLGHLHRQKDEPMWPWVRFVTPDNTEITTVVMPEKWSMEDKKGNEIAYRIQVPLILAWAMSVHKSQGQTLPYATVDLRRVFERGQAYVAISRATSLEGLRVEGFDRRKIYVDKRVVEFNRGLAHVSPEEIEAARRYFETEYENEFGAQADMGARANVVNGPAAVSAPGGSMVMRIGGELSAAERKRRDLDFSEFERPIDLSRDAATRSSRRRVEPTPPLQSEGDFIDDRSESQLSFETSNSQIKSQSEEATGEFIQRRVPIIDSDGIEPVQIARPTHIKPSPQSPEPPRSPCMDSHDREMATNTNSLCTHAPSVGNDLPVDEKLPSRTLVNADLHLDVDRDLAVEQGLPNNISFKDGISFNNTDQVNPFNTGNLMRVQDIPSNSQGGTDDDSDGFGTHMRSFSLTGGRMNSGMSSPTRRSRASMEPPSSQPFMPPPPTIIRSSRLTYEEDSSDGFNEHTHGNPGHRMLPSEVAYSSDSDGFGQAARNWVDDSSPPLTH